MQSEEDEEDIERLVAFDDRLRESDGSIDSDALTSKHSQTIRLLHELFRGDRLDAPSQDPASNPILPDKISRFRILRLLGRGGFGTVYLADDPLLNRAVAIKVIHAHLLKDPAIRRRALREREAMARLQHPNILPVWEAGEDQDQLYIVSEFCAGQTLAQWLVDHPEPLDCQLAASWIHRLADAIAHSHGRGVIHRDLKPGNILLDKIQQAQPGSVGPDELNNLDPRVSDFGLAKILDASPAEATSIHTQTGIFVGSLEYASPEQIKGQSESIGVACDIYALGVLLFQLLTGKLPHAASSQYELARRICEEYPKFPTGSHIPKDLQAIALHALAREPQDRYPTSEALRDDLARFLRGEPVTARPVSSLEHLIRAAHNHPKVAVLATAFCLLASLFFYSLVVNNRQLSEQSQALALALQTANEQRIDAEHQRLLALAGEKTVKELRYRESIKLAFDQWQQNNLIGLHETLQRIDPDRSRTLEVRWLNRQLSNIYFQFHLNGIPVQALTWNSTDQNLVSISASGKLRRWQLDQPDAIREDDTAVGAHSLALHPDGQTIALPEGIKSSTITFWDYQQPKRAQETIQHYSTTVESLEYSPDGKWLAAGPRYWPVIVTELETKDSFAIKSNRRNRQLAFSPQSDRIAVYTTVGEIEVRSLRDRSVLTKILNGSPGNVNSIYSLAWIPGQEALVACAHPERLYVFSVKDGHKIAETYSTLEAESIAVSPDGRRVVLGDNEGFVQLFDLQALQQGSADSAVLTPILRLLNGKITDLTFCSDDRIVAADEEGNMMCWTMPSSLPTYSLPGYCRQFNWVDNQRVQVFDYQGAASHFLAVDSASPRIPVSEQPTSLRREVARAMNSQHIAVASMDGEISILDAVTGTPLATCKLSQGRALEANAPVSDKLLFSQDGKTLFATGENNQLTAINVPDAQIKWTAKFTNSGCCLAENVLTREIYVGGSFEQLKIFDAQTGDLHEERLGGNGSQSMILQPELDRIITGHKDGTVRIGRLKSDESSDESPVIHRISHRPITALTLSPDEKSLVIGDGDGVVRVADLEIGTYGVIYKSDAPEAEVAELKWSPERQRLAALIYSRVGTRSEIVILEPGSKDGT